MTESDQSYLECPVCGVRVNFSAENLFRDHPEVGAFRINYLIYTFVLSKAHQDGPDGRSCEGVSKCYLSSECVKLICSKQLAALEKLSSDIVAWISIPEYDYIEKQKNLLKKNRMLSFKASQRLKAICARVEGRKKPTIFKHYGCKKGNSDF